MSRVMGRERANRFWPIRSLHDAGTAALRMEHDAGGIEVGKLADLMVLSQHLFEIQPDQISAYSRVYIITGTLP